MKICDSCRTTIQRSLLSFEGKPTRLSYLTCQNRKQLQDHFIYYSCEEFFAIYLLSSKLRHSEVETIDDIKEVE